MTRQHFVLFRSLTSFIFIYAGIKHLVHPGAVLKRIMASRTYAWLPYEDLFRISVYASGLLMLAAALTMLAGYRTSRSAALLLAMLVPITLVIQLENLDDLGPFFKNLAISGSLVYLMKQKQYEKSIHDHRALV